MVFQSRGQQILVLAANFKRVNRFLLFVVLKLDLNLVVSEVPNLNLALLVAINAIVVKEFRLVDSKFVIQIKNLIEILGDAQQPATSVWQLREGVVEQRAVV